MLVFSCDCTPLWASPPPHRRRVLVIAARDDRQRRGENARRGKEPAVTIYLVRLIGDSHKARLSTGLGTRSAPTDVSKGPAYIFLVTYVLHILGFYGYFKLFTQVFRIYMCAMLGGP
jgi:hypothetical protein